MKVEALAFSVKVYRLQIETIELHRVNIAGSAILWFIYCLNLRGRSSNEDFMFLFYIISPC